MSDNGNIPNATAPATEANAELAEVRQEMNEMKLETARLGLVIQQLVSMVRRLSDGLLNQSPEYAQVVEERDRYHALASQYLRELEPFDMAKFDPSKFVPGRDDTQWFNDLIDDLKRTAAGSTDGQDGGGSPGLAFDGVP